MGRRANDEPRFEESWESPLCERFSFEAGGGSEVICAEERDGATCGWLRRGLFIRPGHLSSQPEDKLSHSILRFRTEDGVVAGVVESWAPASLISPRALVSFDPEEIFDGMAVALGDRHRLFDREQWAALCIPDEQELALMELTIPEPIVEIVREFSNFDRQMLLMQRLLLGEGSESLVCDECDDDEEPFWKTMIRQRLASVFVGTE